MLPLYKIRMYQLTFILIFILSYSTNVATANSQKPMGKIVEYKEGNTLLEGYLAAIPSTSKKDRPGVLVVHEWTGLGDYAKGRADQLAQLGYIAFAADIYGKGIRPKSPKEAGETASIYKKDRKLMRARVLSALEVLKKQPGIDKNKIGAIGYCFGGTTVLELARSGAPVQGVVSFHGGLSTPTPQEAKQIRAKVLALHGADDPYVTAEEVSFFEKEMREGGVDWQLVKYSKAVHSFTNPDAGNDNSQGAAYNASADHRSWIAMKSFFDELFHSPAN